MAYKWTKKQHAQFRKTWKRKRRERMVAANLRSPEPIHLPPVKVTPKINSSSHDVLSNGHSVGKVMHRLFKEKPNKAVPVLAKLIRMLPDKQLIDLVAHVAS